MHRASRARSNRSVSFRAWQRAAAKPPRIEPTASADSIATVLVGMFLPRKAEAIFRAGLAQLSALPRRGRLRQARSSFLKFESYQAALSSL
jgi:hypothetical protein